MTKLIENIIIFSLKKIVLVVFAYCSMTMFQQGNIWLISPFPAEK